MGDTNIDTLSIEIQANATSAGKAIDTLVVKLDKLSSSMSGLDTQNLNNLARNLNALTPAVQQFASIDSTTFKKIAKDMRTLANIDTGNLSTTAQALQPLANGLQMMSGINGNSKEIASLINSLTRLGNTNINSGQLRTVASDLLYFVNIMSGAEKVSTSTISMTNALARLGAAGANLPIVTSTLSPLSAALLNFMTTMSNAPTVSAETIQLTSAIGMLASAGSKTLTTASNLSYLSEKLLEFMTAMSKAPAVSQNTISMTSAIANLANSSGRASINTTSFSSSLGKYSSSAAKATKKTMSLASAFGKFYASYFLVVRAFKTLWSAIESSTDYVEIYNYFDAAFGQVADQATEDFSEAGYESAEAYYNSFSSRAATLTKQMSGFEISDSGSLSSTGTKSFGIDPTTLMNYQSVFAQMSSSMDVSSESALRLSTVLTEIGADLASVKNMEFEDVWENMASAMAGMSRTVDKYGVNIRTANLNTKLAELGIDATVSELSQADKVLLRTIVLVDSSRYAWGDLADTITQPANQLRLLQSNLSNLARTIGNIFLPIVAKALPYINSFVQALQQLAEWIVELLGFEDFEWGTSSSTGTDSDLLSDLLDSADEATDSLTEADEAAESLYSTVLGIDELNINSPDTTSTTSSDSDSATSDTTSGLITDAFNALMDEYQEAWDAAFDNMEERYNTFANNIAAAFKSGGLYGVGEYIGNELTKQLQSIDWEKIYSVAEGFGSGLANFLNGLISPELFSAVGTTIANALNTKIYAALSFAKTFDWTDFGNSLAAGLNSFFANYDFLALADTINSFVLGILDTIITFIDNTDWEMIGTQIGTFLANIKWGEIALKLGEALWKAINAAIDVYSASFDEAPFETIVIAVLGLRTVFKKLVKTNLGTKLFENLSEIVKTLGKTAFPDATGAVEAFTGLFKGNVFSNINTALMNIGSSLSSIAGYAVGAVAGVGEFVAVEKIVSGLKDGTLDWKVALLELAGVVAIAGAALTAVLGPAGWAVAAVIAGVGAAVAVLSDLFSGSRSENALEEKFADNEDYQSLVTALDEVETKIDEVSESYSELKSSFQEGVSEEAVEENFAGVDELAEKYYELSQKENLTTGEQELLITYAEELKEKIPDLAELIDEETGAYKGTYDQLTDTIEKTKEYYKVQAAEDYLMELYSQQYEAERAMEDAKEAAADANAEVQNLENELAELKDEYSDLEVELAVNYSDEAKQNFDDIAERINQLDGDNGLIAASQEKADELVDAFRDSEELVNDINTDITDTEQYIEDISNSWDDTADTTEKSAEKIIESIKKIDDSTSETKISDVTDDIVEFLESDADMAEKSAVVGQALNAGLVEGITGSDEPITTSEDMVQRVLDKMKEAGEINSPSKVTTEYGKYLTQGLSLGLIDSGALMTIQKRIEAIADNYVLGTLEDADLKTKFYNIGVNVIQGLIDGIENSMTSLSQTMQEVADTITQTVTVSLDIHSPSKVMEELGIFTMQGFQNGIESLYNPINASLSKFGTEMTLTASPNIEDLYYNGNSGLLASNSDNYSNNSADIEAAVYSAMLRVQNSNTTETVLLQELISAVRQGQSITIDGKELVSAIKKQEKRNGFSFT